MSIADPIENAAVATAASQLPREIFEFADRFHRQMGAGSIGELLKSLAGKKFVATSEKFCLATMPEKILEESFQTWDLYLPMFTSHLLGDPRQWRVFRRDLHDWVIYKSGMPFEMSMAEEHPMAAMRFRASTPDAPGAEIWLREKFIKESLPAIIKSWKKDVED